MPKQIIETIFFDERSVFDFAEVSGDKNKIHLDSAYASTTFFKKPIVHGAFAISKLSAIIAKKYINVILLEMNYKFLKPIFVNSSVKVVIDYEETGETKESNFKFLNSSEEVCIIGTYKTKEKFI